MASRIVLLIAILVSGVPASPLEDLVDRYSADRTSVLRRYTADYSPERYRRLTKFYRDWQQELAKVGMLFWRMHRQARIIFSLRFHLGEWTPQQAIDFLVDRVGHERANAEAEVRRSFNGTYPPLYQLAYMMGGLQCRAMHAEIVPGKMTNRQFHDTVMQTGSLPVELVRASVTKPLLPRDFTTSWRFAGALN